MPNNNKDIIGLNREKTFPKPESQGVYKKYKELNIRCLN